MSSGSSSDRKPSTPDALVSPGMMIDGFPRGGVVCMEQGEGREGDGVNVLTSE